MQRYYLEEEKKDLILHKDNLKNVFALLIRYIELNEFKTLPDFELIKNAAMQEWTAQDVFGHIAVFLVREDKYLSRIKFLIEECKFDLKIVKDENGLTLLHEACLYGSINIAKYLLKVGFDPNAVCNLGMTPLHQAVQFEKNTPLIDVLKEKKCKMNIKDGSGMTPLHVAALRQNSKAIIELRKAGADWKIKLDGMTYLQLSAKIKNGSMTVNDLPVLETDIDKEEELQAKRVKSILEQRLNVEVFKKVVEVLLAKNKSLNINDAKLLIDCYILAYFSDSFDIGNFTQLIQGLINKQKLTLFNACIALGRSAMFLANGSFAKPVEQLNNFIYMLAEKIDKQPALFIEICNSIVLSSNQAGNYQQAEEAALCAVKKISEKTSAVMQAFAYYNLGRSQRNLIKLQESAKSFEIAFSILKDDVDIFRAYLIALLEEEKYDQAYHACAMSKCGDYSRVTKIQIGYMAGDLSCRSALNELQTISTNDILAQSLIFDLQVECYARINEHDQAIKIAANKFDDQIQGKFHVNVSDNYCTDVGHSIVKYLNVYIISNKYEEGLIALSDLMKKYEAKFSSYYMLMTVAAIIYSANGYFDEAEAFIQKIEKINPQSNLGAELYLQLCLDIPSNNPDRALKFAELALQREPDNRNAKIIYTLILLLMRNQEKIKSLTKETVEIISEFEVDSEEEKTVDSVIETGPEIDQYDQKKIHAYFQEKKQQLRLDISRNLLGNSLKPKMTWIVQDVTFKENDKNLVSLDSCIYTDYYAVIAPHVKLNNTTLSQFEIALSKGLCRRRKGQNGIKIFDSLVELKIDEDIRLYTTVIYKNSLGKYLIVFDQTGNHEDIKHILREKKPMQIVEVSEESQQGKVACMTNLPVNMFVNNTSDTSAVNNKCETTVSSLTL